MTELASSGKQFLKQFETIVTGVKRNKAMKKQVFSSINSMINSVESQNNFK